MTAGLERDEATRFVFRVPPCWKSSIAKNPCAEEAQQKVIDWLEALGCTPTEIARARKFDASGYVGTPFPNLPREKTIALAKYLSLWLLWDDVAVETMENRWRVEAKDVLAGQKPPGLSRFDEGWWQLFNGFAGARSSAWVETLCAAMGAWNQAATQEASLMEAHRAMGILPTLNQQVELRVATIGMYATVYLLEDAYDQELPAEFHSHPTIARIKWLANEIVGLGNDIFSLGKDFTVQLFNLVTTLMKERKLAMQDALAQLVRRHNEALLEYDKLAASLHGAPSAAMFSYFL